MNPIAAYKVGGNVIIVDEYHGCDDCGTPLGLSLHIFSPKEAKEWLDEPVSEVFEPKPPTAWDERCFGFVGKDELVAAAAEFEEDYAQYDSLSDFLSDFGLRLLQSAMKKRTAPAGNLGTGRPANNTLIKQGRKAAHAKRTS
jgi:hypothetical protein